MPPDDSKDLKPVYQLNSIGARLSCIVADLEQLTSDKAQLDVKCKDMGNSALCASRYRCVKESVLAIERNGYDISKEIKGLQEKLCSILHQKLDATVPFSLVRLCLNTSHLQAGHITIGPTIVKNLLDGVNTRSKVCGELQREIRRIKVDLEDAAALHPVCKVPCSFCWKEARSQEQTKDKGEETQGKGPSREMRTLTEKVDAPLASVESKTAQNSQITLQAPAPSPELQWMALREAIDALQSSHERSNKDIQNAIDRLQDGVSKVQARLTRIEGSLSSPPHTVSPPLSPTDKQLRLMDGQLKEFRNLKDTAEDDAKAIKALREAVEATILATDLAVDAKVVASNKAPAKDRRHGFRARQSARRKTFRARRRRP